MQVLNPGVSDHSPLLLRDVLPTTGPQSMLFKFVNYIVKEQNFLSVVQHSWSQPIQGTAMFCLWKKLLRLQPDLRLISRKYGDIIVSKFKLLGFS